MTLRKPALLAATIGALVLLLGCASLSESSQNPFIKNSNSIAPRRRSYGESRQHLSSSRLLTRVKTCPALRAQGANVPLVQIRKKSSNRFLCNGVLLSNQMVLTTATCVEAITNPSRYQVGFRGPSANSSTVWHAIGWSCKQPEFEPWRSAHHNTGLVVLDRAIAPEHYECLLQAHEVSLRDVPGGGHNSIEQQRRRHLNSGGPAARSFQLANARHQQQQQHHHHHHHLMLMRFEDDDEPRVSRAQSVALTCRDNETIQFDSEGGALRRPAGEARRFARHQASVCRLRVDAHQLARWEPRGLCGLESALALVALGPQRGQGAAQQLSRSTAAANNIMLGLVDVSHETLDSEGCLAGRPPTGQEPLELRMLNLSRLWSDGHLHRLMRHCSKSRRRRRR